MKTLCVIFLIFISIQEVGAKRTWERDPASWSLGDCEKIIKLSPWHSECYLPLRGGEHHYLIRALWDSPVIICAEARLEQLESGNDEEFMRQVFREKLGETGLEKDEIISIRVYPMKGLGMVGQKLHSLVAGDPFIEGLAENIKLIRNRNKNEYLTPVELRPLEGGLVEGFQLIFKNDGFISARTWRAELVLEPAAGEFKFRFDPREMTPAEVKIE